MNRTIDNITSESNTNDKLMNGIPNELKFSSKIYINGKKYKPISITSENLCKGKNIWAVHAVDISCLWDTGASHFVINQHYVKKF